MEQVQEITLDLRRPPRERWRLTDELKEQARDLARVYKADLGSAGGMGLALEESIRPYVRPDHWEELEGVTAELGLPVEDVALGNFYYDDFKTLMMACSAFAVDAEGGVLHARNLDWWSDRDILHRYTLACHVEGAPAGPFTSITWPGFLGVLSGVAAGRFAITLNAAISPDAPVPAMPVGLSLRTVFEEAASFDEAVERLRSVPLRCDCLLLVTGVRAGEIAVVERTPTRSAVRRAQHGFACVTNEYRELPVVGPGTPDELLSTSCQRFDRLRELEAKRHPRNADQCFAHLNDPYVRMQMTVQQMVFEASTGACWLK